MGRRSKWTYFQRRHTNGQQVHEKMLNTTTHQGNANQNHTSQNGYIQKRKKQVLTRMWRKGTIVHCWECKLVQPLWNTR